MKNFNFTPFLFFFFAMLTMNVHCEKEKDIFEASQKNLPAITSWGANTFGCKKNGGNWVAYSATSAPEFIAGYDKKNNQFYITAFRHGSDQDKFETVGINIYNFNGNGVYYLQGTDPKTNNFGRYTPLNDIHDLYETSDNLTGKVHLIKFDTVYQIASGTFQFQCTNGTQVISITEGRFDVQYSH